MDSDDDALHMEFPGQVHIIAVMERCHDGFIYIYLSPLLTAVVHWWTAVANGTVSAALVQ